MEMPLPGARRWVCDKETERELRASMPLWVSSFIMLLGLPVELGPPGTPLHTEGGTEPEDDIWRAWWSLRCEPVLRQCVRVPVARCVGGLNPDTPALDEPVFDAVEFRTDDRGDVTGQLGDTVVTVRYADVEDQWR